MRSLYFNIDIISGNPKKATQLISYLTFTSACESYKQQQLKGRGVSGKTNSSLQK
jgi:hypothetical protein